MREFVFDEEIKKAVSGNHDALENILEIYKDLIEKHSYVKGNFDEDLYQYISIRIALNITKFKI